MNRLLEDLQAREESILKTSRSNEPAMEPTACARLVAWLESQLDNAVENSAAEVHLGSSNNSTSGLLSSLNGVLPDGLLELGTLVALVLFVVLLLVSVVAGRVHHVQKNYLKAKEEKKNKKQTNRQLFKKT